MTAMCHLLETIKANSTNFFFIYISLSTEKVPLPISSPPPLILRSPNKRSTKTKMIHNTRSTATSSLAAALICFCMGSAYWDRTRRRKK